MKGLRKTKVTFSVKAVPVPDLEISGVGREGGHPDPEIRECPVSSPPVLSPRSATVKIVYK